MARKVPVRIMTDPPQDVEYTVPDGNPLAEMFQAGDTPLPDSRTLRGIGRTAAELFGISGGDEPNPQLRERQPLAPVTVPSFNEIAAKNFPGLFAPLEREAPMVKWKPLNMLADLFEQINPELRARRDASKKLAEKQRMDSYAQAIDLYNAELKRTQLFSDRDEANARMVNEDIDDFNRLATEIVKKKPNFLDAMRAAIGMYNADSSAFRAHAAKGGNKAAEKTVKDTADYIKNLDKDFKGQKFDMASGAPKAVQLDKNNPQDLAEIQKRIKDKGYVTRLVQRGLDTKKIYDVLQAEYGLDEPYDRWLAKAGDIAFQVDLDAGNTDVQPPTKSVGGTETDKPKAVKPVEYEVIPPNPNEDNQAYTMRVVGKTGSPAKGWAYMFVNQGEVGKGDIGDLTALLNTPEWKDKIQRSGTTVEAVLKVVKDLAK